MAFAPAPSLSWPLCTDANAPAHQTVPHTRVPRAMPLIPPSNGPVLVVDDVRINRFVLCRMLHSVGYSTVEAENGADALRLIRSAPSGHYCCMVLDLQMPVLNGYDTARAIRAMELASPDELRLPIFCCTTEQLDECTSVHPEHTVHQHSLLCGFDEVMVRVGTYQRLLWWLHDKPSAQEKPTTVSTMRSLLYKYTHVSVA